MVRAIKQTVIVQPGGFVEVRSPELRPGDEAEVIVLVKPPQHATGAAERSSPGTWRRHAGTIHSGDPQASNNQRIDRDLARGYGDANEPRD